MPNRQQASGLFGLDGSSAAYYQGTSAAGEPLNTTSDDQQLFNDSSWPYQSTPPYDTYDSNPFYNAGWDMNQQIPVQNGIAMPQPMPSMNEPGPSAYSMKTPLASPDITQSRPVASQQAANPLSDEHRQMLQKIAMPPTIPYHSPRSEPSPNASGTGKASMSSSPEGARDYEKSNTRKRKSSADDDDDDDDDDDAHQPVKKTAHNMIEKRYRTNLNDKIAALRDSVPSLRIMSKSARGEDTTEDREELQGLTPAHKLNKATVLSKATEYIRHLEKRNSRLMDENAVMLQRIAAFEKLFLAGAINTAISPHPQHAPPTPTTYPQDSATYVTSPMGTTSQNDPQSLVQASDDMKRMIAAQLAAGQPYPVPQQMYRPNPALIRQQQIHHQQQQQQMQAQGWHAGSPYYAKLMVGSLAALMLLEAVRENEQSNETPEGRGLFALPIHLLRLLTSSLNINFMGYSFQGARVIYSIKVVLLMCSLWWALMPSLFDSKPRTAKQSNRVLAPPKAAPSLACPIHVRRQAWLTAIQTVWVPRHNFFLEAAALGLKTVKLSLRNLIGVQGYQMLTGLTEEQEMARVKAWAIALDAQLAGGDGEISKSRLTLTLLASATLPTTPLRLMLKALHIRVLLWELGSTGVQAGVQVIAAKLARSKWNEAQQLYRLTNQLRRTGQELPDDDLPDHLAALLEQDCDQVLNPAIIQRASNLAWNEGTEHLAIGNIDSMATVVDDQAVRSPMDAVAAWWSTMILQGVLTRSLATAEDESLETAAFIEDEVSLAIRTAPIGSIAQQRALVARALLSDEKRSINILAALQAIGPVTPVLTLGDGTSDSIQEAPATPLKELPSTLDTTTELRTSLLCAMAIAHLQKYSPPDEPVDIYAVISQIQPTTDMGLLGYTSAYKLVDRLAKHEFAAEACVSTLERLLTTLRAWTGKQRTLEPNIKARIVDYCLSMVRSITGMDSDRDTGYGSMSDATSDYGTISDLEPEVEIQGPTETVESPSCGCSA